MYVGADIIRPPFRFCEMSHRSVKSRAGSTANPGRPCRTASTRAAEGGLSGPCCTSWSRLGSSPAPPQGGKEIGQPLRRWTRAKRPPFFTSRPAAAAPALQAAGPLGAGGPAGGPAAGDKVGRVGHDKRKAPGGEGAGEAHPRRRCGSPLPGRFPPGSAGPGRRQRGPARRPPKSAPPPRPASSSRRAPAPQPRSHTRSPRRTDAKAPRARVSAPRGKQASDCR